MDLRLAEKGWPSRVAQEDTFHEPGSDPGADSGPAMDHLSGHRSRLEGRAALFGVCALERPRCEFFFHLFAEAVDTELLPVRLFAISELPNGGVAKDNGVIARSRTAGGSSLDSGLAIPR